MSEEVVAEHYADPLDLASAIEQAAVTESLKHVTRYRLPEGFDGTCTECGEDVHPDRARLGLSICIDCAEHLERVKRVHRSR